MNPTRKFELSTRTQFAIIMLLAALTLVGAFRVMAAPPEVPQERPPAALYAISWQTASIAATTTSTSYLTQNYAYQDVSCAFDFLQGQTVVVSLEASNDDSDWFQTHTFTAVTTDTTVTTGIFSRTVSYGRYERMKLTLSTANTVTPTCKSVFFNNWMPTGNAQPMN